MELLVGLEPLRRFAPRGAPAAPSNYTASVCRCADKYKVRDDALVNGIEPLRRYAPRGAPAAHSDYISSVCRLRGQTEIFVDGSIPPYYIPIKQDGLSTVLFYWSW